MTQVAASAASIPSACSGCQAGRSSTRPKDSRDEPCERIELLDRRVGAVGDDRAGVQQRAVGIRAAGLPRPEPVGGVTVGCGVAELHRCSDPELGKAADVLGCQQLRVLDALPQAERRPDVARLLERVERVAIRPIADRMHGDRPAGLRAAPDDLRQLGAARDLDARAVQHASRLRPERPVHERLQVADPQHRASEPAPQPELFERVEPVGRKRLPDPQRQIVQGLPEAQRADPAVLVVDGRDAAGCRDAQSFAHRRDVVVVGDLEMAVAELPAGLLPQDAGGLAALVQLHHAAGDLEISVTARQPCRVEPE